MEWYVYNLLGVIVIASMILIFKWLTLRGIPDSVILFFVFLFAMIFYLSHVLVTNTPLQLRKEFLVLLFIAAFLSYVGNLLYLRALSTAPNAGYAAAVNALQIVVITLGAVILFRSELTLEKGIGIGLALGAIFLLAR